MVTEKFELDEDQVAMLNAWKKEQREKVAWIKEKQKDHPGQCSGDSYIYMFAQTGIGVAVQVVNNFTKDKIDISMYEKWRTLDRDLKYVQSLPDTVWDLFHSLTDGNVVWRDQGRV